MSTSTSFKIHVPAGTHFPAVYQPYAEVLHAQKSNKSTASVPGTERIAAVFILIVVALAENDGHLTEKSKLQIETELKDKYKAAFPTYARAFNTWLFLLSSIHKSNIRIDSLLQIHLPRHALYDDRLSCAEDFGEHIETWTAVISDLGTWSTSQLGRQFDELLDRCEVLYTWLLSCPFYVHDVHETVLSLHWNQIWLPCRQINGEYLEVGISHIALHLPTAVRGCDGPWHDIPLPPEVVDFLCTNWPSSRRNGYLFGPNSQTPEFAARARATLASRIVQLTGVRMTSQKIWHKLETDGQMAVQALSAPPLFATAAQAFYRQTYVSFTSLHGLLHGIARNFADTRPKRKVSVSTLASDLRMAMRARSKEVASATENDDVYKLFRSYIDAMLQTRNAPTLKLMMAKRDELASRLMADRLAGKFSDANPVGHNLGLLVEWCISQIDYERQPAVMAKYLQLMHNWILAYLGTTPFGKVTAETWAGMLRDFDFGNKQDSRSLFLSLIDYLNAAGITELDTARLLQQSFSEKDFSGQPVELLGAYEARDLYLRLPAPAKWYFTLMYGLGLRVREAHLLTLRSVVLHEDDELIIYVLKSKTRAGFRMLPVRQLMPPAMYQDFVFYVKERKTIAGANLGAPLIERYPNASGDPENLNEAELKRELQQVEGRLQTALDKVPYRRLRPHDLRRTFSNNLILRLFEVGQVFGGVLQPVAHDPEGAKWCPVPYATAHLLHHGLCSWKIAHGAIDLEVMHTAATIMGHYDSRTTGGNYFQGWLILMAAWLAKKHDFIALDDSFPR